MQRRTLAFLAVMLAIFPTLAAQLADPGPSRSRPAPFSLSFHTSFGHGRHGPLALGRPGFGRGFFFSPFRFAPLHFSSFRQPFGGRFIGRGNRFHDSASFRFHAGPSGGIPYYFDPGLGYGTVVAGPDRGGWDWFVEEWGDQDPQQLEADPAGSLSESLLLQEGMSPEEVMRVLGSPLQRIEMADRQVWKYSGYSLLFEGGALKEMR